MNNRLHNAGILTYLQLAALTPEQIIEQLGLSAMSAKNVVKQDWVGQARRLAPASEHAPSETALVEEEQVADLEPIQGQQADDSSVGRQHYATFTVELLLGEESEVRRTRVKHIQEGEQETWAGWEDGRLVSFFVEHAALRTPAVQTNNLPSAHAAGADLDELDIEVDNFDVSEAFDNQENLHAEVEFHLSGLATKQIANTQATYFLHILAYMISSGETIVLAAMQGQLEPDRLIYTKTADFAPPQAGRYQLLATVVLSEYNSVGTAVGPKLRVEP